jgi:transcriptional regulator with XRE-family HTH domain
VRTGERGNPGSESGLSRVDFAAASGTSPSRLSTYLNAKVTPSAALLVRFERVAARRSP